ncbi:GntR family transcriptional regulator [Paracoccus luteus]|uniref:GntR family transcriptional regulator n=1 Tax=Paracoccus luteus TaxID=2508543 RepID=UPI00106F7167|nr:GntR family transcriptional regulator [Paracoccus luteus]
MDTTTKRPDRAAAPRDSGPHAAGARAVRRALTWQSVQREILARIKRRVYPPGDLIPTEEQLAAEMGCARATVNRALTDLADRGVVERRRRVGTRVALAMEHGSDLSRPVLRTLIEGEGRRFGYRFLGGRAGSATHAMLVRLMAREPARVRETQAMFLADDHAFCHERRFTNMALVPQMTDAVLATTCASDWLWMRSRLTHAEIRVSASTAGQEQAAEALECAQEAPVIVYDTCSWIDAQPLTSVRYVFHPEVVVRNPLF